MPGPSKMSAELRTLKGNPGNRRQSAGFEPRLVQSVACPEWLTGYAAQEWEVVAPTLNDAGLLAETDVPALAAYCQCYAQYRQAQEQLRTEGLTVPLHGGGTRINPLATYSETLLKQMRAYAAEFGFTPLSRGKISKPVRGEEHDEFNAFVAGD